MVLSSIETGPASGGWLTNRDELLIAVTRDPDTLGRVLSEYRGGASRSFAVEVDEVHRLAVGRCPERLLAGVLVDRDDAANPSALARELAMLLREGPTILLTDHAMTPPNLFDLFEAGVTPLRRSEVLAHPRLLCRLLEGDWMGVQVLHAVGKRFRFSPTEMRAFLAACAGLPKVDAADRVGCSVRTLESHWSRIFGKVGIRSTEGVLSLALRAALSAGAVWDDACKEGQSVVSRSGDFVADAGYRPRRGVLRGSEMGRSRSNQ